MNIHSRRDTLVALATSIPAAALAPARVPATTPTTTPTTTLPTSALPWSTTAQGQMRDLVRVMGDLSGRKVFSAAKGELFGAPPGVEAVRVARWEAIRVSFFTPQPNGDVEHRYWSALFVLDENGRPFETFRNPLNGATGKPTYRYGGPSRAMFSARGLRYAGPDGQIGSDNPLSNGFLDPFTLPWAAVGEVGWVDYQTPFTLLGGVYNDHSKYRFALAEFADRSRSSVSSEYQYYGESPYYPWMQMGERPGNLRWQALGLKTSLMERVPASLLALCDRFHPGLLEKPESFDKRDTRTT
jgi:hypothetical protein